MPSTHPSPPELTASELAARLASPAPPLLLDVREPQELAAYGWIDGATHIPMMSIPDRMDELDRKRDIVIYCAHGIRSYDVGCFLMQEGFPRVSSLEGGLAAWPGPLMRTQ